MFTHRKLTLKIDLALHLHLSFLFMPWKHSTTLEVRQWQ